MALSQGLYAASGSSPQTLTTKQAIHMEVQGTWTELIGDSKGQTEILFLQ